MTVQLVESLNVDCHYDTLNYVFFTYIKQMCSGYHVVSNKFENFLDKGRCYSKLVLVKIVAYNVFIAVITSKKN